MSILENWFSGKCTFWQVSILENGFSGKCPFGHIGNLPSVYSGKWVFGEMSIRPNVHSGKCPFWKMYIRGNVRSAKCFSGKCPFCNDGHSGATSAATFSVAVAAAPLLFFVTSDKRQRRCFLTEKAEALQRCFLCKNSAAAATSNKLLPRLF